MVTYVIEAQKTPSIGARLINLLQKLCSFPAMLLVLLAVIVFLVVPKSIADPDIFWHMRNAQVLFQTHTFLRRDLYSFTVHGKPWIDPEWLGEVPFYIGWQWLGAQGVFSVQLAAIEAILLGIFGLAYLQSRNAKAAFVAGFLAIFLADVSFGPRTLLFGWVFLVVELAILYKFQGSGGYEGGSKPTRDFIWLLPPLFILWINTHGSWMMGLALLGLFVLSGCIAGQWGLIEAKRWTRPQMRKLLSATGASALGLFVNPYGWRLVRYPFDTAFRKMNIEYVQEWASLNFHSARGKIVLAMIVGAILLQLYRQRKWMLYEVAFLLVGLYAALTYSRFLFLAAILILPIVAKDLVQWMPFSAERDKPWLNIPIMGGLAVAVFVLFPSNGKLQSGWQREYPQTALSGLQHFHPHGNVFNQYEWGGYLIWNLRQIPVFADSREDIFERHGVVADYLNAVRLKNTFAIFDKYSIRYVLFRKNTPLTFLLLHSPGWKIDYQDKNAVLFEKTAHPLEGST